MYVHMYMYISNIYVYVYIYICIYVYVYVYIKHARSLGDGRRNCIFKLLIGISPQAFESLKVHIGPSMEC